MKHLKSHQHTSALRPAARGQHNFGERIADRSTTHWLTWRHIRCKLTVTTPWISDTGTLLQLEVIASRDTPVPITGTGYLAHLAEAADIAEAGGPVPFMTAWLDRAADTRAYKDAEFLWRQGDLFPDADASR